MKKIFLILFTIGLIVLTQNELYSFNRTVQIVVKGVVLDEYTGQPIETDIEFKTESGKRFKIKSNSIDGKFEQVFNAGEKATILFSFWNVARKSDYLEVKDTIAYTEQHVVYTARKLSVGAPFFRFNMFKPGTSEFNSNSSAMLDSIENVMKFARNIKVEFRVNSHDSYAKFKKAVPQQTTKKSTKKKKKNEEPQPQFVLETPDIQSVNSLVSGRVSVIEQKISDWKKYLKKITVAGDVSSFEESEGTNLDSNYDFEVIVTELDNTLE